MRFGKTRLLYWLGIIYCLKVCFFALETHHYKHLQTLSTAVKQMSEGELLQIEKARKLDINESIYFDIIRQNRIFDFGCVFVWCGINHIK